MIQCNHAIKMVHHQPIISDFCDLLRVIVLGQNGGDWRQQQRVKVMMVARGVRSRFLSLPHVSALPAAPLSLTAATPLGLTIL